MPSKVFKKYNLVKLIKVIRSSLIVRLTITSRISVIIPLVALNMERVISKAIA